MSTHLSDKTKAQIPKAALARHTLLFEDARTRITQWVFAPGDQTGWHRHEWDYVTVQQSGGRLRLEGADGTESFVDYTDGRTMSWRHRSNTTRPTSQTKTCGCWKSSIKIEGPAPVIARSRLREKC